MDRHLLNKYLHLKDLFINISSLTIIQIMNIVFPAVTLPYLVRVLGPENYGLVNFAIIIASYFMILSEYGFNLSATKEISVNRKDKLLVEHIFSDVFFSKALLGLLSLVLYLILIISIDKFSGELSLYLISFSYVIGAILFPMWYFQGTEKMALLPALYFLPRLTGTVLIFILVKESGDYLVLIIIYSAVQISTGLSGFLYAVIKNKIRITRPSVRGIKKQLANSYKLFLSNVSISIYTTSAPIFLGFLEGNSAVGIYVAADKIRNLISSFLSTISTGVYPYINKLLQDSEEGFIRFNIKLLKLRGIFTFILSCLLFIFADVIVKIILGDSFSQSAQILRVLAFLPFIITLSNSFGIQMMLPLNKDRQFLNIVSSAAVINLLLTYLLISGLRISGAAYSILFTEMFVSIAMYFYIIRSKVYSGNKPGI